MPSSVQILSSALRTASGTGPTVDLGATGERLSTLDLSVLAVEGDDTVLSVTLEDSADGTIWANIYDFRAVRYASDVGSILGLPPKVRRYVRARWTLTGTAPSVHFGLGAYRMTGYVAAQVFEDIGLPDEILKDLRPRQLASILERASQWAEDYLADYYTLPLIAYSSDLERAVAMIAAYDVMSVRGFQALTDTNSHFRQRYDDAIKWLEGVGETGSPGIVGQPDPDPEDLENSIVVVSRPERGWYC